MRVRERKAYDVNPTHGRFKRTAAVAHSKYIPFSLGRTSQTGEKDKRDTGGGLT